MTLRGLPAPSSSLLHLWSAFRRRDTNPLATMSQRRQRRFFLLSLVWPIVFAGTLAWVAGWIMWIVMFHRGFEPSEMVLVYTLVSALGILPLAPVLVNFFAVRPRSQEHLEELLLTGMTPRDIVFGAVWRGAVRYASLAIPLVIGSLVLVVWYFATEGALLDQDEMVLLMMPLFLACWCVVALAIALRAWTSKPGSDLFVVFRTWIEAPLWLFLFVAWLLALIDLFGGLAGVGHVGPYFPEFHEIPPFWKLTLVLAIAAGWMLWTRQALARALQGAGDRYFRSVGERTTTALWWQEAERAAKEHLNGPGIHRLTLAAQKPQRLARAFVCGWVAVVILWVADVLLLQSLVPDFVYGKDMSASELLDGLHLNMGALSVFLLLGPPVSAIVAGFLRVRRVLLAGALRPSLLWPAFLFWWPFAAIGFGSSILWTIAGWPLSPDDVVAWTSIAPAASFALTLLVVCVQMEVPRGRRSWLWNGGMLLGMLALQALFLLRSESYELSPLAEPFNESLAGAAVGIALVVAHRVAFGGFQRTAQRLHERHLRGLPFFTAVALDEPPASKPCPPEPLQITGGTPVVQK